MTETREDRNQSRIDSLEELLIKISFKMEVDLNNFFLASSLTYFFGVLFACLTEAVEGYFGIILILTAVMIIWYFKDKRSEIQRRYERRIESLIKDRSGT